MLRALLPALQDLKDTGLWQHGKEDKGQAVLHRPCSPLPLQGTMLGAHPLPCAYTVCSRALTWAHAFVWGL